MEEFDRRQLLRKAGVLGAAAGGLWVAPSVLTIDTAWAFGSCAATISAFPTTAANTDTNGWLRAVTGTFSTGNPYSGGANGALGISPTAYLAIPAPVFLVEDDPTVLVAGTAIVTYTTSVNVVAGHFYRFTFQAVCTAQNTGPQILDVLVNNATQTLVAGSSAGVGLPSTFTTDNTSTLGGTGRTLVPNGRPGAAVPTGSNPGVNQPPGTYRFVYHATATGAVNFQYKFTLNTARTASATTSSDDIGVSAPTIECSLTGT